MKYIYQTLIFFPTFLPEKELRRTKIWKTWRIAFRVNRQQGSVDADTDQSVLEGMIPSRLLGQETICLWTTSLQALGPIYLHFCKILWEIANYLPLGIMYYSDLHPYKKTALQRKLSSVYCSYCHQSNISEHKLYHGTSWHKTLWWPPPLPGESTWVCVLCTHFTTSLNEKRIVTKKYSPKYDQILSLSENFQGKGLEICLCSLL